MARNGRTKVIYKGTFVSIQTLCLADYIFSSNSILKKFLHSCLFPYTYVLIHKKITKYNIHPQLAHAGFFELKKSMRQGHGVMINNIYHVIPKRVLKYSNSFRLYLFIIFDGSLMTNICWTG